MNPKIKMLKLFYVLLLFGELYAQDYIHVLTNSSSIQRINLSNQAINTPIYAFDSTFSSDKNSFTKKQFTKPPFDFQECIYIIPSNSIEYNSKKFHHLFYEGSYFPSSFLFHSDTINANLLFKSKPNPTSDFLMYLKVNKSIDDFYHPFYFRKTEVTNKEYREFVHWVADSIVRKALAEKGFSNFQIPNKDNNAYFLNKNEQINWQDSSVIKALEFLFKLNEERYFKKKELDARKINYEFKNSNGKKNSLNIYPDTLKWIEPFDDGFLRLEENMCLYFWHPAYDNYPVTCITQKQAEAFLAWKTQQMQSKLDLNSSKYTIVYELPTDVEWEMLATKDKEKIYSKKYTNFYLNSFVTNLKLNTDSCININVEHNTVEYNATVAPIAAPILFAKERQNGLYLFPVDLKYECPEYIIDAYKDENAVFFMGGNVSEWMKDTYQTNWLPIYTYHQNKLKKINSAFYNKQLELENYYNSYNDTNGVLVRGGNWFDLSLSHISNKNFDGINKKIFVDPNKSFATVGFRYVVRVYRKEE